jgi:hypothetical protein
MLCEKTKEGATQLTAGKCSKEEARNREAAVRTQQKDKCSREQKKMKFCPDLVRVQQD